MIHFRRSAEREKQAPAIAFWITAVEIGFATVDQSGNWRFANARRWRATRIFTAVATDPAGNSGQPSGRFLR